MPPGGVRVLFFFNDTATTEIYTLSLHDALPISLPFGRGKELASSVGPVMNKVVSGWTASGITTFSTGSPQPVYGRDRKSTRLNSSHGYISYAVFCLKKKNRRDMPKTLRLHCCIE